MKKKLRKEDNFQCYCFTYVLLVIIFKTETSFFFFCPDSLIQANKFDENSRFYKFASASKFVFFLKWH